MLQFMQPTGLMKAFPSKGTMTETLSSSTCLVETIYSYFLSILKIPNLR